MVAEGRADGGTRWRGGRASFRARFGVVVFGFHYVPYTLLLLISYIIHVNLLTILTYI